MCLTARALIGCADLISPVERGDHVRVLVLLQCCQPCVLPAKLGLFCCGVAFFLKTCWLLVFGLVLIEICLFFGFLFCRVLICRLLFSQILWHFCRFNLLLKAYWACFCENLLILGLSFRICHPDFMFDFLADFSFC